MIEEEFTVTVTVVGGEVRPPQSVATTPTPRGGEGGRGAWGAGHRDTFITPLKLQLLWSPAHHEGEEAGGVDGEREGGVGEGVVTDLRHGAHGLLVPPCRR